MNDNGIFISNEQIKRLKIMLKESEDELKEASDFIEKYGSLDDCGTYEITATFEQGYYNALWTVLSLLGLIEYQTIYDSESEDKYEYEYDRK